MSEEPTPEWTCMAGRTAFFGGRWKLPCQLSTENQHIIIASIRRVELCDTHFEEVKAAGLVTDPYISEEVADHMANLERLGLPVDRGGKN